MNTNIIFYIKRTVLVAILALFTSGIAVAQPGAGSVTIDNGYRNIAATDSIFEFSETFYIGPDANWEVAGTVILYSQYIWIAPSATINGTGKILIADPGANLFYTGVPSGQTVVDGNNGNPIGVAIEHHNPENIILSDIADPGYGTSNPSLPLAAALNIGADFLFEVDNGDVLLNGNDLSFDVHATVSNFGTSRMIVTGNSIDGHVVKRNSGLVSFVFPVGIAEGDYTPAVITGANDYYVSVTDYTASDALIIVPEEGMDRAWHIYGGGATNVTLQHNSPDTDGIAYVDSSAFITQYQGGGVWSISGAPDYISSGLHTNPSTIPLSLPSPASEQSWFTKSSDLITPLPTGLLFFEVQRKDNAADLLWRMVSEQNMKGFEIERSVDGQNWTEIGFVESSSENGNSNKQQDYAYTDLNPVSGYNYYRLRQLDHDGNGKYGPVRFVKFDKKIKVYPTHVTDNVIISGLSGSESIAVYDALGRKVKDIKSNDNFVIYVDMSDLDNGYYHINILSEESRTSQVVVLSK